MNASSYPGAGQKGRRRAVVAVLTVVLASTVFAAESVATEVEGPPPITEFLLKQGESSTFEPGKDRVFRTVSGIEDGSGEGLTPRRARRLEGEGFVEAAAVRLRGTVEGGAFGYSEAIELGSSEEARAEMKAAVEEDFDAISLPKSSRDFFRQRRFKVPGVSDAVGFSFVTNGKAARLGVRTGVARAFFREGNCLLSIAVLRMKSTEVMAPVIRGVQAVYRRTGGVCPTAEAPTPES